LARARGFRSVLLAPLMSKGQSIGLITVTRTEALAAAREMEAEQRRGKWRGPLHGIPIALKDNMDTAGIRTTAASELFKDRVPSEDAEVVRRLKNGGAILLGKTNLHEFAYGGSSSVSYFRPVHNPWALDRVPGGSSGGSAAATAAGLCFGSLGTDTAGSVRIPACYCGIVGFKPTYGRVSNRGVIPLSWSLDHVGPICRTVEDAALMLSVIAGYDELDPTTVVFNVVTMSELASRETARQRFTGWLMAIFAGCALVLAMIGIYGVVSYAVTRRTQEIGIRMALGAARGDVMAMIVRNNMALIGLGLVVGTGAALGLTRLIETLLYGVAPTDPVAFTAAALALASVALVACVIPASRATRIAPASALRNE
jgi:hypothetical protein